MIVAGLSAPRGGTSPLGRRNPVAKLGAAFVPAVVLMAGVDPVSSGIVAMAALLSVPAWGLTLGDVARRAWPLALAVGSIAVGNMLFTGRKGGSVLVDGRIGALIDLLVGFHPDLTGEENAYLLGSMHGLGRKA
jgi:hypothetical protein